MIQFMQNLIKRANYKDNRYAIKRELEKSYPAQHIKFNGKYATLRRVSLTLWENDAFFDIFQPIDNVMVSPDYEVLRFYEYTPNLDPADPDVAPYLKTL